ncbi:MAG: hypothetical protein AAF999_13630 [Pseudomonadota bacterium]
MPSLPSHDLSFDKRPTLSIDWEIYAAMLEASDMSLEEQKELIETLWSIVVMFVDLGFDLNPAQQICEQAEEGLADGPPDLVELMGRDFLRHAKYEEDA